MSEPGNGNLRASLARAGRLPVSRRPNIRAACFDDYEAIASVESDCGLQIKTREDWLYLWTANPAYKALGTWTIGWVAEDECGQIVGTIGNIPFFYELNGRRYVAACGRGWAVRPGYRKHSLQLLAHQVQQPRVDLLLTTTANLQSAPGYAWFGWSKPPVGHWDRSAFWVTSYTGLARGYRPPTPRNGSTADFAQEAHKLPTEYSLEWRSGFDTNFDVFWETLKRHKPHLLLSLRTKSVLDWHFRAALEQNRVWILTASNASGMIAYAIFERSDTQFLGIARMRLVDLQLVGHDPNLCLAMIACCRERCRRERIALLDNPGCWIESPQFLDRRTPYHRSLRCWPYFYKASNQELAEALKNATSWHPTYYDGDATL